MLSKPRESLGIGSRCTSFCISRVSFMAEAFYSSMTGDPLLDMGPFAGHGTLCCSASALAPLPRQHNMKQLYGAENSCMHMQLGQILDKRYKETKNPTAIF